MQEFRVRTPNVRNAGHERGTRVAFCAAIFALLGLTLFGLYGRDTVSFQTNRSLAWVGVAIVMAAFGGACYVAVQIGGERVKRGSTFVLTDNDLVWKRDGWPDERIALPKISAMHEDSGWLVIESDDPPLSRIRVPFEIEQYSLLVSELEKHHPIAAQRSSKARSAKSFVALVVLLTPFVGGFTVGCFMPHPSVIVGAGLLLWIGEMLLIRVCAVEPGVRTKFPTLYALSTIFTFGATYAFAYVAAAYIFRAH